jgi:hypothetical protein
LANRHHLSDACEHIQTGARRLCHTGDASALDTVYCFFFYVYIEISIFIQVAHVLGVLLTLILVIFTR